MRCEWKKRTTGGGASASDVTSLRHALPTHPINALSARVTSSFKQFGSEFPFASYLTPWFMVKRETPKSQNVGTSFRSLSKINGSGNNGTKRSYSRSLQEVPTGECIFPKGAILLFGSFPNKCPAPGRPSQSTTRPDQGQPLLQTGFLHVCSRTS